MNLETVLEMWKTDSVIDELNLDGTTVRCALIHSKYLELFSVAKLTLKRREAEMALLFKDKWLYYNGKMEKSEMDKRGWKYDPFDSMSKPMKGDMEMYYETDDDIRKLRATIDYQKTLIEALDEILTTIRWRHSAIKNCIEWKKFAAGC